MKVCILEGCERYEELSRFTANGYVMLLNSDPGLSDGDGNCWVVAAIALGTARALGINAVLRCGKVREASGKFAFGGGEHYWLTLDGSIILDSPDAELVLVGSAEQRKRTYIPLQRKTQIANLKGLIDSAHERALIDHQTR